MSADSDGLTVERGDPWNTFPNETRVLPLPTSDALETMTISPDGQLTAIGRLQVDSNGMPTVPRSASVLVVNNARAQRARSPNTKQRQKSSSRRTANS